METVENSVSKQSIFAIDLTVDLTVSLRQK
jgi:hypothetical protein